MTDAPAKDYTLRDEALRIAEQQDSFAAVLFLASQADSLVAAKTFSEAMLFSYWQAKNLPLAVAFGRAGVQFALTAAETLAEPNSELANSLRSTAKALAYNVASFTWPGWNEPGIAVTAADVALGLDAAKTNLRLANELQKGDLPLSRAHWMLGAQQLAAGDFAAATNSFVAAETFAAAANTPTEALLARGFVLVTHLVAAYRQGTPAPAAAELATLKQSLAQLPDGEAFCSQFDGALAVFL
jgi:hypothetical protein